MKMLEILILFIVISTSNSDTVDQNGESNSPQNPTISDNRRRLSIFPKNHMRFTVNPLILVNKAKTTVIGEVTTKKPVMAKFIPKSKILSDVKNTETTRRPLMKLRTYTVTMRSKSKVIENINKDRSHDKRSFKKEESSEEKTEEKPTPTIQSSEYTESGNKSAEDQDENEFIFLDNNKKQVLNHLIEDSEEDIETTTVILRKRRKRSSNIIEEENMGTTISAFKYTSRDTKLNSNPYFKNINS